MSKRIPFFVHALLPAVSVTLVAGGCGYLTGGVIAASSSDSSSSSSNQAPVAFLDEAALAASPDRRDGIPIPFRVEDQEGDLVRVVCQWQRPGLAFPALPSSISDLEDLLENPARETERALLQVCTELPTQTDGLVAALPAGFRAERQARLPELARRGLPANGVANQTLEILRSSAIPRPVAWSSSDVRAPAAILPVNGGTGAGESALVLDGLTGWRLLEVQLATGNLVRSVASGAGVPRALGYGPNGAVVFVATDVSVVRIALDTGAVIDSVGLGPVFDGARGLAVLGTEKVLVTGEDTGGDGGLFGVSFAPLAPAAVVKLVGGLNDPRGVVSDPLQTNHVYVAEHGANRIVAVDINARISNPLPGTPTFSAPTALALERNGARLLVLTNDGGSLRGLNLRRSPANVFEIAQLTPEVGGCVATGRDGLRLVTLASSLAVGGGVEQRRTIVAKPVNASDPLPYDPTAQVLTVTEDFAPLPSAGDSWRLSTVPQGPVGPTGRNVFLWDSRDVPGAGVVRLRVTPFDRRLGTGGAFLREVVTGLDSGEETRLSVVPLSDPPVVPVIANIRDLDADGALDLIAASIDSVGPILRVSYQEPDGTFGPLTSRTGFLGGSPRDMELEDLDGDGTTEVVIASAGSIWVDSDQLAAISASSLQIADMNGDGHPDLLATEGPTIHLFTGSAVGLGTTPTSLADGLIDDLVDSFRSIVTADLGGDSRLDLALANPGIDGLTILLSEGSGFSSRADLGPGSLDDPRSVEATDLNADGHTDLVVAGASSIAVLLQTGPASFQLAEELGAPGVTEDVKDLLVADLDADLDPEITSAGLGQLTSFYQQDETFEPTSSQFGPADTHHSVAGADLNGDGMMDVVSGDATFLGYVTVVHQSGPGTFEAQPETIGGGGLSNGTRSIDAIDLDGDGDLDLLSAVSAGNGIRGFLQETPGGFTPTGILVTANDPRIASAADVDSDGVLELIVGRADGLFAHDQTDSLQFGAESLTDGTSVLTFAIADLDRDGLLDQVLGHAAGMTVLYQDGFGTYQAENVPGGETRSIAVADLDPDGDPEIVVASASGLLIHRRAGPRDFDSGTAVPDALLDVESVLARDVDLDGTPDVVASNAGFFGDSPEVRVHWRGASAGYTGIGFQSSLCLPILRGETIAVTDLDGDHDQDLVLLLSDTGNCDTDTRAGDRLVTILQESPRVFSPASETVYDLLTTGDFGNSLRSQALVAADIDSDGEIDLISADYYGNRLAAFFGNH